MLGDTGSERVFFLFLSKLQRHGRLSSNFGVDVVSEAAFEFVVHIAGEKLQLRAGEKIEFQGWVGALRALGGLDEYRFADPCPELQQPREQMCQEVVDKFLVFTLKHAALQDLFTNIHNGID